MIILTVLCIVLFVVAVATLICGNIKIADLMAENWELQKQVQRLTDTCKQIKKITGGNRDN